jgi:hypothetical protein
VRIEHAGEVAHRQERKRWSRRSSAQTLGVYQRQRGSERQRAWASGAPRSTVRRWAKRIDSTPSDEQSAAKFFGSVDGLMVLHRLVLALLTVMTLEGPDGLRKVHKVLALAGLHKYVASSFGSLRRQFGKMVLAIARFEQRVQPEMIAQMAQREVTLCLDETFHPEICLVSQEPVSNYIIAEQYSPRRDVASWAKANQDALAKFNGKVVPIQVVSDDARALVSYAKNELDVHHTPDLFHVQRNLSRGTTHVATLRVGSIERAAERERKRKAAMTTAPTSSSEAAVDSARLQEAKRVLDQLRDSVRGLGTLFHPFSLKDGSLRTSAQFEDHARGLLLKMHRVMQRTFPRHRQHEVERALGMVPALGATLEFFHARAAKMVAALKIAPNVTQLCLTLLLPALYLRSAARRAPNAKARRKISATARRLWKQLDGKRAWVALSEEARNQLITSVQKIANVFQRSTSCTEGRNGLLALQHHGKHRLRPDLLRALTVVHNFAVRRPDGTTAAQRFFGCSHPDLFEWLVQELPFPPAPARRRSPSSDVVK